MTLPLATLLIVDDHRPTLERWIAMLESSPLKILTTTHGQTAFDMACDVQPDLILSDLDMPELDGFQLLTLLKSTGLTQDIPVIICSATTDLTAKYLVLTLGAAGYLEKPLDLEKFRDMMDKQCGLTLAVTNA